MTHLDTIIRGCFGASLLDTGCSSSARCRFDPSLGSEGSDESKRPPTTDFGGAAEGSDGAGRPISIGFGAAVEGPDKARWPGSADSEATVEGSDAAGVSFPSTLRARPPPPTL